MSLEVSVHHHRDQPFEADPNVPVPPVIRSVLVANILWRFSRG